MPASRACIGIGAGIHGYVPEAFMMSVIAPSLPEIVILRKVLTMRLIVTFVSVMNTPGVVVDGKVVHAGGIPSREIIETWLSNGATA